MEQHDAPKPNSLALIKTDGSGRPMSVLSAQQLDLIGRSTAELEAMLQEAIRLEMYEKCALIRDELRRRPTTVHMLKKPPY